MLNHFAHSLLSLFGAHYNLHSLIPSQKEYHIQWTVFLYPYSVLSTRFLFYLKLPHCLLLIHFLPVRYKWLRWSYISCESCYCSSWCFPFKMAHTQNLWISQRNAYLCVCYVLGFRGWNWNPVHGDKCKECNQCGTGLHGNGRLNQEQDGKPTSCQQCKASDSPNPRATCESELVMLLFLSSLLTVCWTWHVKLRSPYY